MVTKAEFRNGHRGDVPGTWGPGVPATRERSVLKAVVWEAKGEGGREWGPQGRHWAVSKPQGFTCMMR